MTAYDQSAIDQFHDVSIVFLNMALFIGLKKSLGFKTQSSMPTKMTFLIYAGC